MCGPGLCCEASCGENHLEGQGGVHGICRLERVYDNVSREKLGMVLEEYGAEVPHSPFLNVCQAPSESPWTLNLWCHMYMSPQQLGSIDTCGPGVHTSWSCLLPHVILYIHNYSITLILYNVQIALYIKLYNIISIILPVHASTKCLTLLLYICRVLTLVNT